MIAATITSRIGKHRKLPTQVALSTDEGLAAGSLVQCEQLRTMDRRRLIKYLTTLNDEKMKEVDEALLVSLGLR